MELKLINYIYIYMYLQYLRIPTNSGNIKANHTHSYCSKPYSEMAINVTKQPYTK